MDGNWHYLATTFSSGVVKLYVDAVLQSGTFTATGTSNATARIGGAYDSSFYQQQSADIRVYNRVLTQAEIMSDYLDPWWRLRRKRPWWAKTVAAAPFWPWWADSSLSGGFDGLGMVG